MISLERLYPTINETTVLAPRKAGAILMDLPTGTHVLLSPYQAFLLSLCNGHFTGAQILELAQALSDVRVLSASALSNILENAAQTFVTLRSSSSPRPRDLPDPLAFAKQAYLPWQHPWETGLPYDEPAELDLYVSGRCNLTCDYCFVDPQERDGRSELTFGQLCDVLDQAATLGVLRCTLTGGEPMLRPELDQLVRRAVSLGMHTVVASNGTLLTPDLVSRLEAAGLGGLQISLDAFSAAGYGRLTGTPGGYARVIHAVGESIRAGLAVSVKAVLTKANLGEIGELVDGCAELGVHSLKLQNFEPGLAGRGEDDLFMAEADVEAVRSLVAARNQAWGARMKVFLVFTGECWPEGQFRQCRHALSGFGVLGNGDVTLCDRFGHAPEMMLGNVRDRELSEMWDSPRHRGILQPTEESVREPCSSCAHISACRTGCFLYSLFASGSVYAADPRCPRIRAQAPTPQPAFPDKICLEGKYLFCTPNGHVSQH